MSRPGGEESRRNQKSGPATTRPADGLGEVSEPPGGASRVDPGTGRPPKTSPAIGGSPTFREPNSTWILCPICGLDIAKVDTSLGILEGYEIVERKCEQHLHRFHPWRCWLWRRFGWAWTILGLRHLLDRPKPRPIKPVLPH